MDSIPKFMASVITIVIGILLCISMVICSVVVNSARTYHSSVIEQIEASNFDEVTIQKCITTAKSDKYDLEVEAVTTQESNPYFFYKVTLRYNLVAPIFGKIHTGELIGYALSGAHLNISNEPEPGLYATGSDYSTLLIPWDELLRDGVVSVSDSGIVSTQYDDASHTNGSASVLAGDLLLPYDNSISGIADYGFYVCDALSGIRLPDSLKTIGDSAFAGCDLFRRIDIGSGLESVGDWAFSYGYVEVVTYNGDINDWCKIDFTNLQSNPLDTAANGDLYFNGQLVEAISVPKNVTSLGSAFTRCGSIKSVHIPDGTKMKTLSDHAFYWCCNENSGLTSVYIGKGVETIAPDAFLGCDYLKTIYLSSTVKTIVKYSTTSEGLVEGTVAFDGCPALEYIVVDDNNPYFRYEDKILINDSNHTVEFIANSATEIVIPDGVTTIGVQAAYDRRNLTSVTIPASVTYIARAAFSNCRNLNTIVFEGTMEQWNAITFGSVWNNRVPATEVVCSDGVVSF